MAKDTDIELTVGLSVEDIGKSAVALGNKIKNIFNKSAGKDLDTSLQRVKQQMDAVTHSTMNVAREMQRLESVQLPTQEYEQLDNRIQASQRSLENFQRIQQNLIDSGMYGLKLISYNHF